MNDDNNKTRVTKESDLPVELAEPAAHDAWFRAKVPEALADTKPTAPNKQVMYDVQALINNKRHA